MFYMESGVVLLGLPELCLSSVVHAADSHFAHAEALWEPIPGSEAEDRAVTHRAEHVTYGQSRQQHTAVVHGSIRSGQDGT